MPSLIQSQPLHAKNAHRILQRQFTDLQEIWEGTTRNEVPHDFVFHQALALHDFDDVKYAVLTTMRKFCQLDGYLNTNQLVGYFRGVLRNRTERTTLINGHRAS
jgi:hypothetical protein